MSPPLERLKPIGFWSYARQDDEMSDGRLSRLRSQLTREVQLRYGRQPIQIFQDVAAIPPGAEWEKAINDAISTSTFFIPILTPAFIESEYCCREVSKFLQREAELNRTHPELGNRRRIFPILYIDYQRADPFDERVMAELNKLQRLDLHMIRREGDESGVVRDRLIDLADELADLLAVKVQRPPTAEELAEAARRRAEGAARERARAEARLAEERRQRDEADAARAREKQERERIAAERRRAAEDAARTRQDRIQRGASGFAAWLRPHLRSRPPAILAGGAALAVVLGVAAAFAVGSHNVSAPPSATPAPADAAAAAATAPSPSQDPAASASASAPATDAAPDIAGRWVLAAAGDCQHAKSRDIIEFDANVPAPDDNGWRNYDGAYWAVEGDKLLASAAAPISGMARHVTEYKRC